ncbi:hypothetical protein HQ563_04780 [bacterium]|nr:hypothetical protein [bacterium]
MKGRRIANLPIAVMAAMLVIGSCEDGRIHMAHCFMPIFFLLSFALKPTAEHITLEKTTDYDHYSIALSIVNILAPHRQCQTRTS